MTKRTLIIVLGTVLAVSLVGAVFQSAPDLFQKALRMERSEGDLKGAVSLYEQVVAKAGDEALAAKAQLRIGFCYEALGLKQAAAAFQTVIDDYPAQSDAVNVAREKIKRLVQAQSYIEKPDRGIRLRQVWAGGDVDTMGSPSPDGRYLSFVDWSSGDLAIRDLSSGENHRLTETGGWAKSDEFALYSIWSHSGEQLAFIWYNGDYFDVRIMDVETKKTKVVFADKSNMAYSLFGWTDDGDYLAIDLLGNDREMKYGLLNLNTGKFRTVLSSDKFPHPTHFKLSSNGSFFAYDSMKTPQNCDIYIVSTENGNTTYHLDHPAFDHVIGWTPDGHWLLFASDRTGSVDLMGVQVNEGRPVGEPVVLKSNIGSVNPLGLSKDSRFFYSVSKSKRDVYLAKLDFNTGKIKEEPKKVSLIYQGMNNSSVISPDGNHLAYVSSRGPQRPGQSLEANTICLYDITEKTYKDYPIEVNIPSFMKMRWAKNSASIFFLGRDDMGKSKFYMLDLETGAYRLIAEATEEGASLGAISSEGKSVVIHFNEYENRQLKRANLVLQEIGTEKKLKLYSSKDMISGLAMSSDDKKLAFFHGLGRGKRTLILQNIDGGSAKTILTNDAGISIYGISWGREGKKIFMSKRVEETGKYELWIVPVDGGIPLKTDLSMTMIHNVSMHPDGETIAFTAGSSGKSEIWTMENYLPKDKQ